MDTRIGIDITSITLNGFADTMVILGSDADFVPAAKLARTHGIDVILDPIHGNVDVDLNLHIDGKKSFDIVSMLSRSFNTAPQPTPDWWAEESVIPST